MECVLSWRHGTAGTRQRPVQIQERDFKCIGNDRPGIEGVGHCQYPLHHPLPFARNGRTARMEASGTAILITGPEEKLPSYINTPIHEISLPETSELPEKPKWSTLFIAAGKKDKVNKIDIVGFLTNKAHLKKEDIGLIEVKDFFSFVAVRKSQVSHTLQLIKQEKIKNKKVKIDIAK